MPGSGAGVRDGGAGGDGAPVQLPRRPGPGPGAWQGGRGGQRRHHQPHPRHQHPQLRPQPRLEHLLSYPQKQGKSMPG